MIRVLKRDPGSISLLLNTTPDRPSPAPSASSSSHHLSRPQDPSLTVAPPAQLSLQLCDSLLLSLRLLLFLLIFLLPLFGSQLQIHWGSVLNGLCPGWEQRDETYVKAYVTPRGRSGRGWAGSQGSIFGGAWLTGNSSLRLNLPVQFRIHRDSRAKTPQQCNITLVMNWITSHPWLKPIFQAGSYNGPN